MPSGNLTAAVVQRQYWASVPVDYYLMEDGNRFLGTGNRGAAIPADNKRRKQQYPNRVRRATRGGRASGSSVAAPAGWCLVQAPFFYRA